MSTDGQRGREMGVVQKSVGSNDIADMPRVKPRHYLMSGGAFR